MTLQDLSCRVAELERAVARLSLDSPARNGAWYLAHAGWFKDDPVYKEIVDRGRAYRDSLARKQRGNNRRTKR